MFDFHIGFISLTPNFIQERAKISFKIVAVFFCNLISIFKLSVSYNFKNMVSFRTVLNKFLKTLILSTIRFTTS